MISCRGRCVHCKRNTAWQSYDGDTWECLACGHNPEVQRYYRFPTESKVEDPETPVSFVIHEECVHCKRVTAWTATSSNAWACQVCGKNPECPDATAQTYTGSVVDGLVWESHKRGLKVGCFAGGVIAVLGVKILSLLLR